MDQFNSKMETLSCRRYITDCLKGFMLVPEAHSWYDEVKEKYEKPDFTPTESEEHRRKRLMNQYNESMVTKNV